MRTCLNFTMLVSHEEIKRKWGGARGHSPPGRAGSSAGTFGSFWLADQGCRTQMICFLLQFDATIAFSNPTTQSRPPFENLNFNRITLEEASCGLHSWSNKPGFPITASILMMRVHFLFIEEHPTFYLFAVTVHEMYPLLLSFTLQQL